MSEDKNYMVKHPYEPYLVKAPCWIRNGGKTEILYDYVPASFARHPCDLFDKNGNRELWEHLTGCTAENCKNMLPKDATYLWRNITANGLEVSSFGRVGIPIICKNCKGCIGCKSHDECERFHYILPQREKCSWSEGYWDKKRNAYIPKQEFEMYNGWLVVDINGEERLVYELVAEAFGLKKDAFQKMKKFMEKKKLDFGDENKLKDAFNNEKLQIHHINNNGHHNTPWNGEDGNLIALPESVHEEIHKIKTPS